MKITLADFVGTASAEPQLVSLSAVNIKLTTSRLKALEAKIERMKKKPQTEARKQRIKEAKATVKTYTAALKAAQKELKSGDKKPAKTAKGKVAAKPATKTKSGGSDEKRDRLISKLKAAEKEHADAKATYVKNSIPESRAYEKIQHARNLLDQHEGKELLKEAEAGGKYKFHHTHSAKDILKHMPIETIRKESAKISKLASAASEKAWGAGSRGKTEAQLDKDRQASRLLSNKSGALRSALALHKKNERTKADRDPVVKKLNATIDKARGLLGMQMRKRRGEPNQRLIKGYQDKIQKAEADLAAHLAKKKK